MKKQYIISIPNKKKREQFISIIKQKYKLKFLLEEEYMINSNFPFIVDFKKKYFWVCESITCCSCAAQKGLILSFEQFKDIML